MKLRLVHSAPAPEPSQRSIALWLSSIVLSAEPRRAHAARLLLERMKTPPAERAVTSDAPGSPTP